MLTPSDSLASRMSHWAVGWRRSHTCVSLSASRCVVTTGSRSSFFGSRVTTLLRNILRP